MSGWTLWKGWGDFVLRTIALGWIYTFCCSFVKWIASNMLCSRVSCKPRSFQFVFYGLLALLLIRVPTHLLVKML